MDLGEIPKYVRYDFLITFLGLFLIGSGWYFIYVDPIDSQDSTNFLFIIGLPLIIWGFGEMYNNYRESRDLRQLQIINEKVDLYNNLIKHKVIDKKIKTVFVDSIKEEINEIVEKEKDNRSNKSK